MILSVFSKSRDGCWSKEKILITWYRAVAYFSY